MSGADQVREEAAQGAAAAQDADAGAPAQLPHALLPSMELSRIEFWRSVQQLYHEDRFCDLLLRCRDGRQVRCHKMVLAPISKVRAYGSL